MDGTGVATTGRKRLACGAGLVVAGAGLAAASAWSRGRYTTVGAEGHGYVWSVSLTSGLVQWSLQSGAIDTYHFGGGWEIGTPPSEGAWVWRTSSTAVQPMWSAWGWGWTLVNQRNGWHRFAATPVLPFAIASLAVGSLLVRSGVSARRRVQSGLCLKCGYDLRGLKRRAPCPECGRRGATT